MTSYNIVASTDDVTVVAEYSSDYRVEGQKYQSEGALEKEFIRILSEQGYEYLSISSEADFINNLRKQLEKLNKISFSDNEWSRLFNESIASANEGIVEKTRKIQEDHIQVLRPDDGTSKNIYLIDKKNIHNNYLQVLNQYEEDDGRYKSRYDVTVLVNGLPLEQVFGEKLHTYTIVDAINDGNVLPFRIDFINTIKTPAHIEDEKVYAIDREKALAAPKRIFEVVSYILDHFDQKTKRQFFYSFTAK